MKRGILSILFALVLVVGLSQMMAAPAMSQTTIYVDASNVGDPDEDGSAAHPFDKIQEGIDAASGGDTVNVAAGTYNETIALTDGVSVYGAGAASTTINGGGSPGPVVTATSVGIFAGTTFDGFTITGANNTAGNGGGMYNENSTLMVSNCAFSTNAANYGGGMYNTGSDVTVANCIFYQNMAILSGGGMYNTDSSPQVRNCTFNLNSAASGAGMYNENSSPEVANCIFWGDSTDEIYDSGTSAPTVNYCDVQGGYTGTGNIDANPLFVGGGDLHLQAGSPCIDAGFDDAVPTGIDTDFEGDSRFLDGNGDTVATVDMGADEYKPPPTEVWVYGSWTSQTDVDAFNSDLEWQYDAFAVIQDGIDAVGPPGTVHVLAGTYNEHITLVDGVSVYGVGAFNSIIDGSSTGTVVTATGIGADTTFDGFTITHGSGSGVSGGGMKNDSSTLTVSNCTFDSNTTTMSGGGMYNTSSNVTVTNCIFSNNTATDDGGGMDNYNSNPTITGCTFYHNTGPEYGGGMNNNSSAPTVINCIFDDNGATLDGGGVYNRYQSPEYINCTFYQNEATDISAHSGGMYNFWSTPTVTNCILWGDSPDEIYDDNSTPVVTYCDVDGGYGGEGNIPDDPLFVDAGSGDYHLQAGSPCIDAGLNDAVVGILTDLEGNPRICNGTVDMGAYEYLLPEVWVDDDWDGLDPGDAADGHTFGYDAFAAIQDGIYNVAAGGTVHVAAGYYEIEEPALEDYADIWIYKDGLTLQAENPAAGLDDPWDDSVASVISASGEAEDVVNIAADNVTFDGFTLSGEDYGVDIYDWDVEQGLYSDCTVTNNYITGAYDDGIWLASDGHTISNNIITGNGEGIYVGSDSEDIEITGNTITDNDSDGIDFSDEADVTNISVNFNNISGNGECGVCYEGVGTLDATCNWWGDDSGPTNEDNPEGTGDAVTDSVIFSPWLGYEAETSPMTFIADDAGPKPTDGYITTAVNVAVDGDTILVAAGDYDEDLYIEKSLTIQGAGADVVSLTGTISSVVIINADAKAVVFDGFTVYSESTLIYLSNAINGSSVTISNDILYDCSNGISSAGAISGSSEVIFEDNEIYDCDNGIYFAGAISGSSEVAIQNNNIHDNGYGISLNSISADSTVAIVGNTITNNDAANSGIHIEATDTTNVRVNFNNIVDNGPDGAYYGGFGSLELDAENNWWGSVNGPGEDGANDVSGEVDYEPWLIVPIIGGKSGTVGAGGTLDAISEAGIAVNVTSGSATITAARYAGNPSTGSFSGITGQYIDIQVTGVAPGTEIEIRLYYTDAEVTAAGVFESTLRLRFWDGDSWELCSDSGVNTTYIPGPPTYSGYMWARITDTSTPSLSELLGTPFGGGGALTSGGSGGGGGGGVLKILHVIGMVTTPSIIELGADGTITVNCHLVSPDGNLTLDIAHGTKLLDSKGMALDTLSLAPQTSPPAPPSGAAIILAYDFGTNGATFGQPITMTIHYDPTALPENIAEENLYIAYWNGSEWVALETTVDTTTHKATCHVSHFTNFALIGTNTPAPSAEETTQTPLVEETPQAPPAEETPPAPASTGLWLWIIVGVVVVGLAIFIVARRRA